MKQFNLSEWLQNKSRKVVTRDGRPVRIVCWDRKYGHNDFPIIALEDCDNREYAYFLSSDGKLDWSGSENIHDIFFADEEEELTEFEKELQIIISEASRWTSDDGSMSTYCQFGDKEIKKISAQILDIARKELESEFKEELDKAYKCADKVQYENGKKDALKDLPKWKKNEIPDVEDCTGFNCVNFIYKGYYINYKDLFEKLPKEE